MTTQEKLKAVIEQIRKDLPRLLKLTVECILSVKESIYSPGKTKLLNKNDKYIILKKEDKGFYICNLCDMKTSYLEKEMIIKDFEIIGHEPMLNDVLEWFDKLYKTNPIFFQDILYQTNEGYLEIWRGDKIVEKWDLSKPYLKDQSDELIDFLFNLIESVDNEF